MRFWTVIAVSSILLVSVTDILVDAKTRKILAFFQSKYLYITTFHISQHVGHLKDESLPETDFFGMEILRYNL